MPGFSAATGAAAAALFTASASAAATLPHIQAVAFTANGDGTYDATITGLRFGAPPDGIPCTSCAPQQMQVADMVNPNAIETINVTAWSDESITLSGVQANPGDAMRLAVWNATAGSNGTGNAAAWGGLVSPLSGVPRITHIVASGSGASLTVTVSGSGFGPAPAGLLGQTTNSPYFVLTDYNATAPGSGTGSGGYPWNAGFCGTNACDGVTLGYVSWTDTEVVVSGFGGSYGANDWVSNPRDAFCVGVWPSTSTSGGTTGGALKCKRLP